MIESAITLEGTKKKQSLLIVDDDGDITFVLQMMLSEYYDVKGFNNPVDALRSVKPGRYDLILLTF